MSYLSNKIGIIKDIFMGNLMKLKVIYDICLHKAIDVSPQRDSTIVVSLTSYGKRVKGSVIYTIYSLLKQTVQPERIVLWLNEKEYSDNNLPAKLRFLCRYGLEVRYCRDIRSYTKIIHALSAFPDRHIITVDDDIWLYIMGLRCQAEKRMLTESQISYYHTDLLRQYFTKDRLTAKNRLEGENDIQLQALLSHYNISL